MGARVFVQAPQYGSMSPHYGGGPRGGVVGGSPQAAASPHQTASPQVPSPQGQTLDLSVNRIPHRLAHAPQRWLLPKPVFRWVSTL